jgi:dolichyl-phosphate beta-glucosyltransferase
MLSARGQYLLMVDADGATKFEDLDKVEQRLVTAVKDGQGIGVGSRAHLEEKAIATVCYNSCCYPNVA